MASSPHINLTRPLSDDHTMTVTLTVTRRARIRIWFAMRILRLSVWAIGLFLGCEAKAVLEKRF